MLQRSESLSNGEAQSNNLGGASQQPSFQPRENSEPILLPSMVTPNNVNRISNSHLQPPLGDASVSTAVQGSLGTFSTSTVQPTQRREYTSQSEVSQSATIVTGSWVSGSSEDSERLKVPGRGHGSERLVRRGSYVGGGKETPKDKGGGSPGASTNTAGKDKSRRGSMTNRRGSGGRSTNRHKSKASRRDSTEYYDDSSGSDEWDDEANIKSGPRAKFMPLYRMDGAIKKKGEYKPPDETSKESTKSETESEVSSDEPPPPVTIMVSARVLRIGLGTMCFWVVLGMVFLLTHAIRFYVAVQADAQRQVADSALLALEAGVATALAPAVSITRSLRIGALAGLLSKNSYLDIGYVVARQMAINPTVEVIKVAGYHSRAVVIRPGDLHVSTVSAALRHPTITELGVFCEHEDPAFDDLLSCLGRWNSTSGFESSPSSMGIAARWAGPDYVTVGRFAQLLEESQWVRTTTLAATIDAGTTRLATEVSINLDSLVQSARDAVPVGGALLVCNTDGLLLASSGSLSELSGSTAGTFPTIWDAAATYPWVRSIHAEALSTTVLTEGWDSSDLVLIRPPLMNQSMASATDTNLRFIVFAPRDWAVSASLRALMVSTCIVAAVPALACFCAAPLLALRRCRQQRGNA